MGMSLVAILAHEKHSCSYGWNVLPRGSPPRIITLSNALRDELTDVYAVTQREKITIIPLGLDLGAFADQYEISTTPLTASGKGLGVGFRTSLNIPPDVPLIAVVGRLVPIKNHRLFLAAAQLLHQQRLDVQFVIIGDGELRNEIERDIASRDLASVVKIAGWVQDMPNVYAELDMVAITSDNEGTPVSLIEAIVAGIPVVSTDVGGVRDLLGDELPNALVPPNDAHALASAWQNTLENPPDLMAIRARLLANYGIETVAVEHFQLYQSLLSQ